MIHFLQTSQNKLPRLINLIYFRQLPGKFLSKIRKRYLFIRYVFIRDVEWAAMPTQGERDRPIQDAVKGNFLPVSHNCKIEHATE